MKNTQHDHSNHSKNGNQFGAGYGYNQEAMTFDGQGIG